MWGTMTPEEEQTIRHSMAEYIQRWITIPGKWGGDDFSGLDCSGIIHEVFQAYGLEKRGFDCTANDLFERLYPNVTYGMPRIGDLVFWFHNHRAIHVEMVVEIINDRIFTCGASGVRSTTKTREDAILHNAYIKRNEIHYRTEDYKIINPFKE